MKIEIRLNSESILSSNLNRYEALWVELDTVLCEQYGKDIRYYNNVKIWDVKSYEDNDSCAIIFSLEVSITLKPEIKELFNELESRLTIGF